MHTRQMVFRTYTRTYNRYAENTVDTKPERRAGYRNHHEEDSAVKQGGCY